MSVKQAAENAGHSIKQTLEEYFSSFDAVRLMQLIGALVGGLFAGFLCKRFGRTVMVTCLALAVVFGIADYMHFITIDWITIKKFLGITPSQGFDGIAQSIMQWSTANIPSVVSGGVGFVIGFIVA